MKYDRLTVRFGKTIEMKKCDRWNNCSNCSDFERCPKIYDAIARLAELEDKIENGTLAELHCKVGDTVYEPILGMPIKEWEVESISYNTVYPKGVLWLRQKDNGILAAWKFWGEDFGKKIFTTQAEAEKRLEELRED